MLDTEKIYNMDCLDGLKLLDDECIDLTVTSPPYDNLRTYNGYSFEFENIAKELYRVTKKGGVVVWVVGDETINGSESGTSFRQALYFKEIGFNIHDTMIYEKNSFSMPDKNRYYQKFEYMFVLSKGKPSRLNFICDRENRWKEFWGEKYTVYTKNGEKEERTRKRKIDDFGKRYNIWKYNTGSGYTTDDELRHPAMFPEQLAADHIKSWSNENDVVLDPFMGSGTTAKMALLLNRQFIGFEISEEYCQMANKRIEYLRNQTTIFTDFDNL